MKIKAKFNPSQNAFEFVSLLEDPTTEEVPRFLKPSKKDKQLVQQKKKEKIILIRKRVNTISSSRQQKKVNYQLRKESIELLTKAKTCLK